MIPLHTAWNIGEDSFAELIRRGLEARRTSGVMSDDTGLPLLGDDLVPDLIAERTHAVEVDVPLADIRPWLAQMMRGGGVYGWSSLESADVQSADFLIDGIPPVAVGDRFGDLFEIARIDADREVVWRSCDQLTMLGNTIDALTADFLLHPVAERRTRLLVRIRLAAPHLTRQVLAYLLDSIDLAMTGSQLLNLKRCAESWPRRLAAGDINRDRVDRHQHPSFRPANMAAAGR